MNSDDKTGRESVRREFEVFFQRKESQDAYAPPDVFDVFEGGYNAGRQSRQSEIDRLTKELDASKSDYVRRNSNRYVWLRAGNYPIEFARRVLNDTPRGIDEKVDAAMEA